MLIILFVLIASGALQGQADWRLADLQVKLESIAGATDSDSVPTPEALFPLVSPLESVFKAAPAEDIRPLVSVAGGCLGSRLVLARKDCLSVLLAIALQRFDSAVLLSPHLARLAALLDDDDFSIREPAAFVLATMHPRPPLELVGIVMPRVTDPKRSSDEVMNLIGLLLTTDSTSTPVIRAVVGVVKLRADRGMTSRLLQDFGEVRCTNLLALNFIDESLNSADAGIRDAAVSSLLPQSGVVSRRFQARLMQIAVDPDESERIRTNADEVLRSVR